MNNVNLSNLKDVYPFLGDKKYLTENEVVAEINHSLELLEQGDFEEVVLD